jgi:cell division protein FtsW (lipid II flippase)
MNSLDDLKSLWHTAKTESLPTSKEMVQMVKKFRNEKLRKKWLVIVCSLLIACLILAVMVVTDFKLITTYIGGSLMAISMLLLAFTNIRSLKRFYNLEDCSNVEFLDFIERTRQNQVYYYKKTMVAIVLVCVVGWLLYLYEPLQQYPDWRVIVYALVITYLLIMWFFVRPRSFKKNAEKLEATRQRLIKISNQLK